MLGRHFQRRPLRLHELAASRIRIALTEPDDEQRELADRAVPWLLKDPPTRSKYQAVLDAVV